MFVKIDKKRKNVQVFFNLLLQLVNLFSIQLTVIICQTVYKVGNYIPCLRWHLPWYYFSKISIKLESCAFGLCRGQGSHEPKWWRDKSTAIKSPTGMVYGHIFLGSNHPFFSKRVELLNSPLKACWRGYVKRKKLLIWIECIFKKISFIELVMYCCSWKCEHVHLWLVHFQET